MKTKKNENGVASIYSFQNTATVNNQYNMEDFK